MKTCKLCGKRVRHIGELRSHRMEVHGLKWATRGRKKVAAILPNGQSKSDPAELLNVLADYRCRLQSRLEQVDGIIANLSLK